MQTYIYDPRTGEYLATVALVENPEEPDKYLGAGPWRIDVAPPHPTPGHAVCANAARDGWEIVEDHRGREGYVNGAAATIRTLGPLPEGWSDTPPEHEPTEEEKTSMRRAEADAILLPLTMKLMAETAPLSDAELVTVGAAGFFVEWTAGEAYAAGKRLVHEGIVYVVEQPVTALEHQPPGAEGMLAIYRPVRPAGGDEPDGSLEHPFDLVVGMAGEVGKFYRHAGEVWECLRAMANIIESWLPGSPGMESFWRKVEAAPAPLMAAAPVAAPQMTIVPVGSSVPEVAEAMALGTTVPTRYLLNTTKTTYHDLYCPDAVSGSLRTLAQIAEMTEGQAKPCEKCSPPALAEAIA